MTNLQMQRGMQAAGEGADTAGASLKQSTAATGQRSPAALALALAFPAALEKYAKNHFHKHLGIKRTLKKPRTQHHPLPSVPCSSPWQAGCLSKTFVFAQQLFCCCSPTRAIINLKKASSLLTLPTALAKYINKRIHEAYIYKAYIYT